MNRSGSRRWPFGHPLNASRVQALWECVERRVPNGLLSLVNAANSKDNYVRKNTIQQILWKIFAMNGIDYTVSCYLLKNQNIYMLKEANKKIMSKIKFVKN